MGDRDPSEQIVAVVGVLHIIDVDDDFNPWQMRHNGCLSIDAKFSMLHRSG